jgi:hypothetical protein
MINSFHSSEKSKNTQNSKWEIAGSLFTCFGCLVLFQNLAGFNLIPIGSFILEIWISIILFFGGLVCFTIYYVK